MVMIEARKSEGSSLTMSSSSSLPIGGTHGHVQEDIQGDLLSLWNHREWKPINNCTGRYTCRHRKGDDKKTPPTQLTPLELIHSATSSQEMKPYWKIQEFPPAPGRTDPILVLPLDPDQTTGIITYVKHEREENKSTTTRYVHTLNAPSGFQRKLKAVGISLKNGED